MWAGVHASRGSAQTPCPSRCGGTTRACGSACTSSAASATKRVHPPGRATRGGTSVAPAAVFRDPDYEARGLDVAAGDDVAFGHCFGRPHGTLINGTATKGIWVRVTFCFRKLDGAWQIVHDQASVPFDVLSGRGVADLEP